MYRNINIYLMWQAMHSYRKHSLFRITYCLFHAWVSNSLIPFICKWIPLTKHELFMKKSPCLILLTGTLLFSVLLHCIICGSLLSRSLLLFGHTPLPLHYPAIPVLRGGWSRSRKFLDPQQCTRFHTSDLHSISSHSVYNIRIYKWAASSEKGAYGNLKKNCEVHFSFRLLWRYSLIFRQYLWK